MMTESLAAPCTPPTGEEPTSPACADWEWNHDRLVHMSRLKQSPASRAIR